MTAVRWSTAAEADLDTIIDFIADANPLAAEKIEQLIEYRIGLLGDFPDLGREGRLPGTRELVIIGTPYLAVYKSEENPLVLRVLHGAQRWPLVRSSS